MATIERKLTIVEFEDGEVRLFKDMNPQILTHMWIGDDIERAYCMLGSDVAKIVHEHLFNPRLLTMTIGKDFTSRMDELIPG
jgi:hypothetical protein